MKSARESGQALVLVLLSLAVVLTLILFILSRTITDIAVSTSDEEAIRAFSAAEAGVEKALVVGSSINPTEIGDASFSANVSGFAQGSGQFNYPVSLASGDSATIWFISHADDGSLTCDVSHPCYAADRVKVCWGKSGASATPAVEVSVFYAATPAQIPSNFSSVRIGRGAYDPDGTRRALNSFSAPDAATCTIDGKTYPYVKTVVFSSLGIPAGSYGVDKGLLFTKVRVLYNTTESEDIGIVGVGDVLPSQGLAVSSTGTSGEANRRLEVFQSWPELPPIFDTTVFSSGGLVK